MESNFCKVSDRNRSVVPYNISKYFIIILYQVNMVNITLKNQMTAQICITKFLIRSNLHMTKVTNYDLFLGDLLLFLAIHFY